MIKKTLKLYKEDKKRYFWTGFYILSGILMVALPTGLGMLTWHESLMIFAVFLLAMLSLLWIYRAGFAEMLSNGSKNSFGKRLNSVQNKRAETPKEFRKRSIDERRESMKKKDNFLIFIGLGIGAILLITSIIPILI